MLKDVRRAVWRKISITTAAVVFLVIAVCGITVVDDSVWAKPVFAGSAESHRNIVNTVHILRYGIPKEYVTGASTVGETLERLHISHEGRTVYPSLHESVVDGMNIHIMGKNSTIVSETEDVDYSIRYVEDPKLDYGTTVVETKGVPGRDEVIYENLVCGDYVEKNILNKRHIVLPQEEVVRRGIANSIVTDKGRLPYKKRLTVNSSAYVLADGDGTGVTSIGIVPYEGIVAVDPKIIPYYTKMYIPGYGFAMAGDCGGAIKGHKIDLFMNTYSKAINWGRKDIEIYIL